jgi:hypothetical protein
MDHRNYSSAKTCQSCRYWSEMIAKAEGGKPVEAYCLNRASPKHQTFVAGNQTCDGWADGYLGAIDCPSNHHMAGGDPYAEFDAEMEAALNDEVLSIDRFEPDYQHDCEVCGQKPTVTGVKDGKQIYRSEMCGPCTFGEAACIDPKRWNDE